MKLSGFVQPLSRRQCAMLLLLLTVLCWTAGIFAYFKFRQATWYVVTAKILALEGTATTSAPIVTYEFAGEPYVARLPLRGETAAMINRARPGTPFSILVSDRNPASPVLDLRWVTQERLLYGIGLIVSSVLCLGISLKLFRTIEADVRPKRISTGMDLLNEEFGTAQGWSAGFMEMLEQDSAQSGATKARASGGSGPTIASS